MILFKTLQMFLLPSVFVFLFILIGMVLVLKSRKKKIGMLLIISGIIFYYLFSITPISDLILRPLENKYTQIEKEKLEMSDKVVLLLGDFESDILRASEIFRIYNQKLPMNNQPFTTIIISGTDPLNPEGNEAEKVKEYLIERGVPEEIVVLENKSRTTVESAKNLKDMVGDAPFFLVTSAYHMPRSVEIFKKFGTSPISAPADFKIEKHYNVLDFFPTSGNLKKSDLAFHEYFGILFYRLKY